MGNRHARGFTLIETLVSLTILTLAMGGIIATVIESSRINKSQKLTAEVQANARSALSLVVQKLRSAGWDPMNAGISVLTLDPDLSDDVSQIEVFADLDMDGTTGGAGEQILIRHINNTIEWRPNHDTTQPFEIVAVGISNDADGDGVIEPMFTVDSPTDPTRITVQVTAESPIVSPSNGRPIRYTVRSDVVLRKILPAVWFP